jgi:nicotinamide-nucleotide amidase
MPLGAAAVRGLSLLRGSLYLARSPRASPFGLREAKLGEAIAELMARGRNPLVGTTASNAILTVRVLARGDDAESARRLRDADCAEIRSRLGHVVFGENDEKLEGAVARLLIEQEKKIATAES